MSRRFASAEHFNEFDFLNEKLRLSLEMSDQAFAHIPEVTAADLRSGQERYRVLMGTWAVKSPEEVRVNIESVMEIPDDPIYYQESREEITGINFTAINRLVNKIAKNETEFKNQILVGEMHTHPITENQLSDPNRPWHPSRGDVESIVQAYAQGELSPNQPFLFGIAGPYRGKTGYAFYRIIKNGNRYDFRHVDWK